MELIKHNADEYGGVQFAILDPVEIEQRLCCADSCGVHGFAQIQVPCEEPEQYRIICKRHLVLIQLMIAACTGDPSPALEAKRIAESIGLSWAFVLSMEAKHAVRPENFICFTCGGTMMAETQGMYKGRRWVHTCVVDSMVVNT